MHNDSKTDLGLFEISKFRINRNLLETCSLGKFCLVLKAYNGNHETHLLGLATNYSAHLPRYRKEELTERSLSK